MHIVLALKNTAIKCENKFEMISEPLRNNILVPGNTFNFNQEISQILFFPEILSKQSVISLCEQRA